MIHAAEGVAEVTDTTFDGEVLAADLPVLVEFTADWCGVAESAVEQRRNTQCCRSNAAR